MNYATSFLAVTLFVLLCSCSEKEEPVAPPETKNATLDSIREAQSLLHEPQIVDDLNGAAGYYLDFVGSKPNRGNEMLSPLAMITGIEMMQFGAMGTSRAEGHNVVWNWGEDFFRTFRRLESRVESSGSVLLANSIWYRPNQYIRQEYLNVLQDFLGIELFTADISSSAAHASMTTWLATQAGTLTAPIVMEQADIKDSVVFLSSLALKAMWNSSLSVSGPESGNFFLADSTLVSKQFLTMEASSEIAGYVVGGGLLNQYHAVSMPLADEGLAIAFIMSNCDCPLSVLPTLSVVNSEWRETIGKLTPTDVRIKLPLFALQSLIDPGDYLKIFVKINEAYSNSADFSGMDSTGSLRIDKILNRSQFTFDSDGLNGGSAGAPTFMGLGKSSAAPMEFSLSQPFVFVVYEKESGIMLLQGVVMDP
jgi:serine protease inhibitor